MLVFEYGRQLLTVDADLMFPDSGVLGVGHPAATALSTTGWPPAILLILSKV